MSDYPIAYAIFFLVIGFGGAEYFTDNLRIVRSSRLATLIGGLVLGFVVGLESGEWLPSMVLGFGIGVFLMLIHIPAARLSRKYRQDALKAYPERMAKWRELVEQHNAPDSINVKIFEFIEGENFLRIYLVVALTLIIVLILIRLIFFPF